MILEQLFFHPKKNKVSSPDNFEYEYSECWIPKAGGGNLHAWEFRPYSQAPEKNITVIHLHGNYGNITYHFSAVAWLTRLGYRVLVFDYSGYGESDGKVSPTQIQIDVASVWNYSVEQWGRSEQFIILGQSLGGFLALKVVPNLPNNDKLLAVVTEGAFSSFQEMVEDRVASNWFFRTFMNWAPRLVEASLRVESEKMEGTQTPILMIHGSDDMIVPIQQGHKLFNSLKSLDKTWWEIPNGGHLDAFSLYDFFFRRKLSDFLDVRSGLRQLNQKVLLVDGKR